VTEPRSGNPLGVPVAALGAVALWGVSFVAVDLALETLQPFGLTAARLLLGGVLLIGLQRLRVRPLLPERGTRLRCAFLGLVLGAHLSIQAYGLLYTSSMHTGWIIGFCPVTVALGAQLFLGRRLSALGWGGVTVATLGVLFVTLDDPGELVHAGFGDGLQLFSCVTWAVYTLAGVSAVEKNGALRVAGWSMLVAGVALVPAAFVTGWSPGRPDLVAVVAVVYLGVGCNAAAFALWYRAQRRHGVHRTGVTLYLEPFVTLVAAVLLLGEPVGWRAAVGGVVMLGGVWLVGRGGRGTREA